MNPRTKEILARIAEAAAFFCAGISFAFGIHALAYGQRMGGYTTFAVAFFFIFAAGFFSVTRDRARTAIVLAERPLMTAKAKDVRVAIGKALENMGAHLDYVRRNTADVCDRVSVLEDDNATLRRECARYKEQAVNARRAGAFVPCDDPHDPPFYAAPATFPRSPRPIRS